MLLPSAPATLGGTLPNMLCCVCGITIQQNPANMCVSCIRQNIDITEDISKKVVVHSCRHCGRFHGPPWQALQLESKELMALCLRKISGLNKVKLIDAVWVWTEPHSLRLKIKVTIQKEVTNGAILQQAAIIEFVVRNQQCKDCEGAFAQGAWHAIVQVRQRVPHKRTFYYLEQLILKHESHMECINIVTFRDGMDFYFMEKNQALRFVEFLSNSVPIKSKYSRKLIGADLNNNTGNYKHNFLVEIAPLCKDDILILPKDLAHNLSNINRLVLTKRVSAGIFVIDPLMGEVCEISAEKYWRSNAFKAVLTSKQLINFTVLSVEPVVMAPRPSAKPGSSHAHNNTNNSSSTQQAAGKKSRRRGGHGSGSSTTTDGGGGHNNNGNMLTNMTSQTQKIQLAECVVARERDLGVNDQQFTCVTHLGNLLKEGDTVLGYDFTSCNLNLDESSESFMENSNFPDIVLVRKFYPAKAKNRKWKLKKLKMLHESDTGTGGKGHGGRSKGGGSGGGGSSSSSSSSSNRMEDEEADYELFLQELESDKDMRAKVNMYRIGKGKKPLKSSSGGALLAEGSTAMEVHDNDDEGRRGGGEGSSEGHFRPGAIVADGVSSGGGGSSSSSMMVAKGGKEKGAGNNQQQQQQQKEEEEEEEEEYDDEEVRLDELLDDMSLASGATQEDQNIGNDDDESDDGDFDDQEEEASRNARANASGMDTVDAISAASIANTNATGTSSAATAGSATTVSNNNDQTVFECGANINVADMKFV